VIDILEESNIKNIADFLIDPQIDFVQTASPDENKKVVSKSMKTVV